MTRSPPHQPGAINNLVIIFLIFLWFICIMYVSSVLDLRLSVVAILWPWGLRVDMVTHIISRHQGHRLLLQSSDGIRVTRYLGHLFNPNSTLRYSKG